MTPTLTLNRTFILISWPLNTHKARVYCQPSAPPPQLSWWVDWKISVAPVQLSFQENLHLESQIQLHQAKRYSVCSECISDADGSLKWLINWHVKLNMFVSWLPDVQHHHLMMIMYHREHTKSVHIQAHKHNGEDEECSHMVLDT